MKLIKIISMALCVALIGNSCKQSDQAKLDIKSEEMMIRISEIQIEPEYLDQYISILREESEASVRIEPGVISIYPMFQKENPNEVRILEIYADSLAYKSHLETAHFKHYKTTTLKMVKSLKLVDMQSIDEESMSRIFKKLK